MVARLWAVGMLVSLVLLAGCQSIPPTTTPTPSRTPTASAPRATPSPTLAAELTQPTLLEGPDHRLWVAGSLTNQSSQAVQDLDIQLEFLDENDDPIDQISLTPQPGILPPGGTGHFVSPFGGERQPTTVRAGLMSYQPSQRDPIELEIELDTLVTTTEGGSRVLGSLEHSRRQRLNLAGFSVLAEENGLPAALPAAIIAPQQLPAGTPSPWLAQFRSEVDLADLSIRGYGLAPETTGRDCQVDILQDPGLQFDPQGNPFFIGSIHNQAESTCLVRLLMQVWLDEEPLDLILVESPIPLQSEEVRPFGFRLEPLPTREQLEGLELAIHRESNSRSSNTPVALSMRLTSVENLGSNVFLKGELSNPEAEPVLHPTIFAALRSTGGQLLTAHWLQLPGPMDAGQTIEFVLPLPRSEGVELGSAEFDLRSLALPSGS